MGTIKKTLKSIFPRRLIVQCRQQVNIIRYKGKEVYCPCCQKEYSRFLVLPDAERRASDTRFHSMIGMGLSENVYCPYCYSTERHRLLRLFYDLKFPLNTKKISLLHFAPEDCFLPFYKSFPNITYLTTDLYDPAVDIKADITNLPFEDNSFDAVICSHVLEHIPDDIKALSEIFRIIRPDGWAIFAVPMDINNKNTYEDWTITSAEGRKTMFGQVDHVRIYGLDFQDRIESVGFRVNAEQFIKEFNPEEIKKYGLEKNDIFYLAHPVK